MLPTYSDLSSESLRASLRSDGDFAPSGSVSLPQPDKGSSATVASLSSEFIIPVRGEGSKQDE